jgi:hypothetical protein
MNPLSKFKQNRSLTTAQDLTNRRGLTLWDYFEDVVVKIKDSGDACCAKKRKNLGLIPPTSGPI